MNRLLLIVLLIISIGFTLSSCSKEEEPVIPEDQKIILLQKHSWILDSTNTITAFYNVMQPEIPPSAYIFETDSMFIDYHGTMVINYGLQYEFPDKIFTWTAGTNKDLNQFMLIDVVTEEKLVVKEIDLSAGHTRVRYMHAE